MLFFDRFSAPMPAIGLGLLAAVAMSALKPPRLFPRGSWVAEALDQRGGLVLSGFRLSALSTSDVYHAADQRKHLSDPLRLITAARTWRLIQGR
ncbi:MAG: hypothetical protein VYD57_09550 [Pseudomonadota bacterium]|nr:hypothetical protein [Pseudomonadota bacterium]